MVLVFLYKITTYPNKKQEVDDYEHFKEQQDWYLAALSMNGQILQYGQITVFDQERFINYILSPEENSLDLQYNNIYVNKFLESLCELSSRNPIHRIIGQSTDFEPSCNCESPSKYILYTTLWKHDSPIVCGDCMSSVPLYKLPKIEQEDEYFTVLSWQKAYSACDRLFMEGYNERGAYKRMSNPTSDISKLGRGICQSFERVTGKPFYYYLFHYYSRQKTTCPICGEAWRMESGFKEYCCEECRLVSD